MSDAPQVLLDGLAYVESARWHDGRLWFAHWGAGGVVAVGLDGKSEVMAAGPPRLGWSIDWLPDGRLLTTGEQLLRQEPDGSMVRHADLTGVAEHGWNEIVVDGRGNIYLNGFGGGPGPMASGPTGSAWTPMARSGFRPPTPLLTPTATTPPRARSSGSARAAR
jgi:sugar lactone lactonase YvrE